MRDSVRTYQTSLGNPAEQLRAIKPLKLWEAFDVAEYILDDILVRFREDNPDIPYNEVIYNEALLAIESLVSRMCGKDLSSFGLPAPQQEGNMNAEVPKEIS